MATSCGSCGAVGEGAFCASCGHPLHDAPPSPPPAEPTRIAAPAQPHAQPPVQPPPPQGPPLPPPAPQGWSQPEPTPTAQFPSVPPAAYPPQGHPEQGYPQQNYPQQGYPQQAWSQPAAPRTNPFVGWPVSDYVRDAGAAIALFCTFGMPWEISVDPKAGNQWWVVIAILLSLVSLAVPYVAKAGVVPGWGPQHYRLTKLGLNLPLLLSVLAAVLFELIHLGDDFEGGLGSGIAMALTGVALAVQPRAAEEAPDHSDDRLWNGLARAVVAASVGLTVLLYLGWFLHGAVGDDVDIFDPFTGFLALTVAFLLIPLALVGYPASMLLLGAPSAAGRRVLATVGFSVVVIALFALASDRQGLFFWADTEKWDGVGGGQIPGGGGLLLGAAAALVVSRAQQRATQTPDAVGSWTATVSAALQVSAAGSALTAIAVLLIMIDADVEGGPVVTIVLLLAATGAAAFGLTLLGDLRKNRVVLLGVLGGIAVVGLVVLGINNSGDTAGYVLLNNGYAVAAWLALPGLAAYALTVPAQVRTTLGPLVAGGTGGHPAQGPPQTYPPQTYPPQAYPPQAYPPQGPPQTYPPQGPPPAYPPQGPQQAYPPQQPPPPTGPPLPPPGPGWGPPA